MYTEIGNKTYFDLDDLTRKHTAFDTFIELATAPYTPTIRFDGRGGAERRCLAGAYDMYQFEHKTGKKSFR